MTQTATPDLAAVKTRQQATWASGDYSIVATRIQLVAERLCDAADLRAGSRVLDVATGSGNVAIAAARSDCEVVGVDYVPGLLERARERAAAERLQIEFVEGDAEELPFPDESFDAVTSVFGVMFAPDQRRAAGELVRVCRPGGTIALASWTPDGYLGEMFRTIGAHVPPPPGVESPMRWGSASAVAELLGDGVAIRQAEERVSTFRFRSVERYLEFFRTNYGPTLKTFAALDDAGQAALTADLVALTEAHDRRRERGGPIAVPATYLEVVAVKS